MLGAGIGCCSECWDLGANIGCWVLKAEFWVLRFWCWDLGAVVWELILGAEMGMRSGCNEVDSLPRSRTGSPIASGLPRQEDAASVGTSQAPRCGMTSSWCATTVDSSSPAWGHECSEPTWTLCCSTRCLLNASESSRPS